MAAAMFGRIAPACIDAPYPRGNARGEQLMRPTIQSRTLACFGVFVLLAGSAVQARQGELPYSLAYPAKAGIDVPIVEVAPLRAAERRRAADHAADVRTKRLGVADARAVSIAPERGGRWDTLDDGSRLWRVRVRAEGATDLRLGFTLFALPPGATLHVIGDGDYYQGPYTRSDGNEAGFRTPVVPGETATIELRVPPGVALPPGALELGTVGAGFRDLFGAKQVSGTGPGASGSCNINVACPLGDAYPEEIRSVGHYEFQAADDGGFYICTGTLVANVTHDKRNLFLTARHCIVAASEAQSMVVYWNYESTRCDALVAPPGGFLNDNQSGAALRATRVDTDLTLVELQASPDPDWNLYYAGWDATGAVPGGTIGIHHPSGDAKKITAGPRPQTMANCIATTSYPGSHWRSGPYTQGTTEGGSSGSALFAAAGDGGGDAGRVIGILSGGTAGCSALSPSQPDNGYDCYGKLSQSWDGGSASGRLRDWLDPAGTGMRAASGIGQNDAVFDPSPGRSDRVPPADLLHSRRR
jgi:lysyl endopeptidase